MNAKSTKTVKQVVQAPLAPAETAEVVNPDAGYTLLIDKGVAAKLSPKSTGAVFFQLAVKDEDNSLHLRISGNEGGGLHSKEWVSVTAIIEALTPLKFSTGFFLDERYRNSGMQQNVFLPPTT